MEYGEFEFSIKNHTFILKHVLYSPGVIKNIISGVEWAKEDVNALINSNNNNVYLNLLDKDYNKIASFQENRNNELHITATHKNNIINNKLPIFSINKNNNEFELLWHRRFGHFYNKDFYSYLKNTRNSSSQKKKKKNIKNNKRVQIFYLLALIFQIKVLLTM